MSRIILHSDLNNFYASVEALNNPSLRGLPIIVCGDPELRHGIVLAKSDEAKRAGIKTGQAIWEAQKLCPELKMVTANFALYLKYANLARDIYSKYSSRVEPYGVDEAWLDISHIASDVAQGREVAEEIRQRITAEIGLTVSIGVSDNKIYSKIGSDIKKPNAVTVIDRKKLEQALDPLPVQAMLYVGVATRKKLNRIGIYTIGQLRKSNVEVTRAALGKVGEILHDYANGIDDNSVLENATVQTIKSIGNSITTARDLCTYSDAHIIIYTMSESVAERLRKYKLTCDTVTIYLRENTLLSYTRRAKLPLRTALTSDISAAAIDILEKKWDCGTPLRTLGVSVSGLSDKPPEVQLSFFEQAAARSKREELERALDQIRGRFGHNAVQRAVLLTDNRLGKLNMVEEHGEQMVPYFY